MKNAKRVIIPVVIVLVVLLALNSCKDTLGAVIDQATGKADTVHRLQRHLEPPDRLLHGPQRRHHHHRLRHRRGHPEV